jgi:DNA-binding MarR family transcriptional regulator
MKAFKPSADPDSARALELAGELRSLLGKLGRRLRDQENTGDLTSSQRSVLMLLEREGPMTVTTLAQAQGVRSQSMGATIAALQAAGLVNGSPDPSDGRRTVLSLTPACQKMIRDGRTAREDWLFRTIQTKFAPREKKELAEAVTLLRRMIEP